MGKDSKGKEKIMKIESALRKLVKEANQKQLEDENLPIDIANIVSDIDNLNKEKQSNLVEIVNLRRYLRKLEDEKMEENDRKVKDMQKTISSIEKEVKQVTDAMRRLNEDSRGNGKVSILLKEVQNMKNQIFYMQQSIMELSRDELALVIEGEDIGPA